VTPFRASGFIVKLVLCVLTALGCDASKPTESEPFAVPTEVRSSVQPLPPFADELHGYPSSALALPSYPFAEKVVVEIRIEGLFGVTSAWNSTFQINAGVGAKGVRSPGGDCAVGVRLIYSSSFGPYAQCPSPGGNPWDGNGLWMDTVKVGGVHSGGPLHGQAIVGQAIRGGGIVEPAFSPCNDFGPDGPCHGYSGSQTIRLTPLSSQLVLLPSDTTVATGQNLNFSATANPSWFGNDATPVHVLEWKWIPNVGTPSKPWNCNPGSSVCNQITMTQTGFIEVTARVNGVVQVDSTRVTVVQPEVHISPTLDTMKFSILIPTGIPRVRSRNDPSHQDVFVSVSGPSGVIPYAVVNLTQSIHDSTGGHLHTGAKPKGVLSQTQVNTGSAGIARVVFTAPQVTGPITVKGSSSGALAGSATIVIGIALVELPSGQGYELVGQTAYGGKHPRSHFMTEQHRSSIQGLVTKFRAESSAILHFNDSSLELGGLFDYDPISNPWAPGHYGHREGIHTDLRTKAATNPVAPALTEPEKRLVRRIWNRNGKYIYEHPSPSFHFHLAERY
jgi:hypothetical protein